MEVKDTGPGMASVLQEMGVRYNPRRLANALKGRQLEINARALRITYTLGKFIAGLASVGISLISEAFMYPARVTILSNIAKDFLCAERSQK